MPSYVLAGLTVVLAVATVIMGFTVPAMWTMASDIGTIKARVETFEKRFDAVDKRFDSLDGKADMIGRRVDGIDARLAARDTDPATMVAASGLRPQSEFAGIRVGGKLFVMPKTDQAAAELSRAGLAREAITPSAFGYVIGTFDSTGAYVPQRLRPRADGEQSSAATLRSRRSVAEAAPASS
ncbi:hypothetical protein [Enterovirga aerilata]|uniref:Uncharacterized protein n=1 Tax=Enterovirga aerilata TaxID=2730920 RepID=A0A849IAF9_9HYPH|nr:hypothetical protein [Enterovirga sp. DB1703]NNM74281.1 hypothetical protein [Enterovirga sp. DB1703]